MTKRHAPKSIPESQRDVPTPDAPQPVETADEAPDPAPAAEPWTPERVTEWNGYYDLYVTFAVLLLTFIASSNRITHSSLWPRLQVGHQIALTSAPVSTDLFSYTEGGKSWVNVPWLFDWGHSLLYRTAQGLTPSDPTDPVGSAAKSEQVGAGALVALTALARLVTVWLLLGIRWPGPGKWWAATCGALALGAVLAPGGVETGGIATPAIVGPGTWGLLLTALELVLIHRATNLGRRGAAFALVPLFLVWANVDDSFFVGLLILGAATMGLIRRARPNKTEEATPIGLPVGLGVLAACTLACIVNPSTVGVFRAGVEPFLALSRPASDVVTIDQLSYFGESLAKSAGDRVQLFRAYYVILVALGVGSFVLNARRFALGRFLVFLLVSVLWGVLIRFQAEFALVFAVVLILNGQEWYQDRFGTAGKVGAWWSLWSVGGRMVTISLIFLCVGKTLLGGLPIAGFYPAAEEPRFGFGFDPDDFPFEVADFLKTAPIKGNVLNTALAQGDALIWRAYPERKTYMDSRSHLYPQELRNELQEIRKALSEDAKEAWQPLLDKYTIATVLIQPSSAPITYRALSQSPNWVPYYDDGQVVLFGRADASAADLAYFTANRLDPDLRAYKIAKALPAAERPPSPVTWMDVVFQTRALTPPQPHNDAARRWLSGADAGAGGASFPDPARCLMAIREARTALAAKPDDPQAFRLLATAYRALMTEETALLAGLKLTPENLARVDQVAARPDLLMTRFRQRVTSISYAIQTTPPQTSRQGRHDLQALNMELYQLFMSSNSIDLARDRLQVVSESMAADDFSPEQRTKIAQDLAQLNEGVLRIQNAVSESSAEQQTNPLAIASYQAGQGAPGMAIHELEDAERTGVNPALVKPRLIDLYGDTGQPEKAIEMFSTGAINDPTFGAEPGTSAVRQSRAYFLLGNNEYAATLLEKYAIPALRYDRGHKAITAASVFVRGDLKGSTSALLDLPDKIRLQAQWEFEAGLCRLEAGTPDLAAEHFTQSLTLAPNAPIRPIAAYYLEKLGKAVPPPLAKTETPEAATAEKPKEPLTPKPESEDAKKGEAKPKDDAPRNDSNK